MKYKSTITLSFLAVGVFSAGSLVAIFLLFTAEELKAKNIQVGDELAASSASVISSYFQTRKAEISAYAHMPLLRTMNWKKIGPFLKSEEARHKGIYEKMLLALPESPGHYYITKDGNPYFGGLLAHDNRSPNAELKKLFKRDYWQYTIANNPNAEDHVCVSNPMISYYTGAKQIMVASTIHSEDGSKVIGMVAGSVASLELDRILKSTQKTILSRFGSDAKMFIVSHDGTYVFHHDSQKSIKKKLNEKGEVVIDDINEKVSVTQNITEDPIKEISMAGGELIKHKRGRVRYMNQETGKGIYLFYVPIESAGYGLGVEVPENVIMKQVYRLYYILGMVFGVVVLLTALLSYFAACKATEPLSIISRTVSEISEGSKNACIDYDGKDEFGVLAQSFNSMIEMIRFKSNQAYESHLKLRANEEKYRLLVETMKEGLVVQQNGVFTFVNSAFCEMLGYSYDELVGREVGFFFGVNIRGKLLQQVELRKKGICEPYEITLDKKNGEKICLIVSPNLVYSDNGEYVGSIATLTDITERKVIEQSLRESEGRLLEAQRLAKLGYWYWDIASGDVNWSDEVYKIFGLSPDEFIPQIDSIMALSAEWPEDSLRHKEIMKRAIEVHETGYFVQRCMHASGSVMYYVSTFQGVYDKDDKLVAIKGTVQDITKAKMDEESIKEQRQRYYTLLQNLNGMVYRCENDKDWTMRFISDGCFRLTGYKPEELMPGGKIVFNDIILPNYREYLWERWQQKLALREPMEAEYQIRMPDGTIKWVWEKGCGIFSNEGDLMHLEGFITDIDDRKKAEQLLRSSEESYQTIFNASTDAIFIHDVETSAFLDVNSHVSELFGYTKDEMLNATPDVFSAGYPPYTKKEAMEWINKAKIYGPQNFEWLCKNKNGELFWVETNLKRVVIGGQPRILATVRDINERKIAEEKLRQSEENLRITLDSIGDAVIATDIKGVVTMMNPIAEKLTGWSFENAKGKLLREVFNIVNADTRQPVDDPVSKVIATGKVVELANHTMLLAQNGVEYQIADSGAPILSSDGEPRGVVLVFRDVTGEYVLQDQLRQSQKMDAIGQLAGGVAHDFNNMLGGIIGAAELLSKRLPDDPKCKKYHSLIVESSEHAAELTGKLLAFARKQPIASSVIDLHETIRDTIAIIESTVDRRIKIKLELMAESSKVIGDPSQLQNALINLCINAVHAMPEGGEINVSTDVISLDEHYCKASNFDISPGVYVQIEVCDTGCGIPSDHLNRIFEPFFTTKEQGKGTGLGLAAVFGTIQQHNGAISVYSEVGVGTSFHVVLPLSEDAVKPVANAGSYNTVSGSGTILVVDDEKVMRITAQAILEDLGYDVITAENGVEALDVFEKKFKEIDLVLLDMIMPEMNGRDCFAKMKKIKPSLKVILSSGFTLEEDLETMKSNGLCGFIHKPYRSSTISSIIHEILKER